MRRENAEESGPLPVHVRVAPAAMAVVMVHVMVPGANDRHGRERNR